MKNKLHSVKLWVTVWAMAIITYAIMFNKTDWSNIIMALTAIPISYSYFNVKQKEIFNKEKEGE